ncbi:hypothetical protein FG386_000067 [Cryptosporidium ryanae]|uniref:uncharacterized protein n=1 Tax=Cryptosporidium ryanae TaxID=515981 RepID=UPI003519DD0C|nr:hypothetical protein FG386_000067 [Cryptosporidium ryanae]
MTEYIMIGSSIFEEEFHKHFFDRENVSEGCMKMFVLVGEEYKVHFCDEINESKSNKFIIPKCVIKNSLNSTSAVLNYIQKNIETVSFGEIFVNICKYLKNLSELDEFVDSFDFILVLSGYYLSKMVNIIIRSSEKASVDNIFKSLTMTQIYEDTFSFLSSLSNSIVIEGRIDKNKNVKIDSNKKLTENNYTDNSEYIKYLSSQMNHESNDKLFKIQSLKVSESSLETVELILSDVVTCAKITINQDIVEITPLKHKYKDFSSLFTTPSFYLFKLEDRNFVLINWSPDQASNTKVNKVFYSTLQKTIIELVGSLGIFVNNSQTIRTKSEFVEYLH